MTTFNNIIASRHNPLDVNAISGQTVSAASVRNWWHIDSTEVGIGESGLNASLAIREAVAPNEPLRMASLLMVGIDWDERNGAPLLPCRGRYYLLRSDLFTWTQYTFKRISRGNCSTVLNSSTMVSATSLIVLAATTSTASSFLSQPVSHRVSSNLKMSDKQEIEVVSQPDDEFLAKKGWVLLWLQTIAECKIQRPTNRVHTLPTHRVFNWGTWGW